MYVETDISTEIYVKITVNILPDMQICLPNGFKIFGCVEYCSECHHHNHGEDGKFTHFVPDLEFHPLMANEG